MVLWSELIEDSPDFTLTLPQVWEKFNTLKEQNDYEGIVGLMKLAIKKNPDEISLYFTCNWALRELKRAEEALDNIREIVGKWTETEEVKVYLKCSLMARAWQIVEEKGDANAAIALAEEASSHGPDQNTMLGYGVALNYATQYHKAIQVLKEGAQKYPEIEWFNGNLVASYWGLSNQYIAESQIDEGIQFFEAEDATQTVKDVLVHLYNTAGNICANKEEWSKAEDHFRKALQLNGHDYLYNNMAWVLREQLKFKEAQEISRMAIEKFPDSKDCKMGLFWTYHKEAWQYHDKLQVGDPVPLARASLEIESNESSLLLLGCALMHNKVFQESVQVLKKGYHIYGSKVFEINLGAAFWGYANQLIAEEQYDKATKLFEYEMRHSLPRTDILAHVYSSKIRWLVAQGKIEDAERAALDATSIVKDNDYLYSDLVYCLRENNKRKEAVSLARFARAMWPDSVTSKDSLFWALISLVWDLLAKCKDDEITGENPISYAEEALGIERNKWSRLCYLPCLRVNKRFEECIDAIVEYEKEFEEETNKLSGQLSQALEQWRRSRHLHDLDKVEETERLSRDLLEKYPHRLEFKLNLAIALFTMAGFMKCPNEVQGWKEKHDEGNKLNREIMNNYEELHPERPRLKDIAFPLKGITRVVGGFDEGGTHCGLSKYCYDFMTYDIQTQSLVKPGTDGTENEHYIGFGEPIYAVMDGVVDCDENSRPDQKIGILSDGYSNAVSIKSDQNYIAWYVHLQQGSVTVKKGQEVKKGDMIGRLGNSGYSTAPHLHFTIVDSDGVSLYYQFEKMNIIDANGEERFSDEQYFPGFVVKNV